ncbi:hypothetical protein MPNT_10408 [Candidatus Methylacidithermus pantelleriae]|uniref:Uncharacterized protein n=1 Tax=Candidatus Methylacidithermus pantelleriae TaxID=2744239 RepID=A0A8J2FRS8_9BACT|nr:hypothetical protein MPNT_10408 [Candidatus Methylacidithermus pantelleriae]
MALAGWVLTWHWPRVVTDTGGHRGLGGWRFWLVPAEEGGPFGRKIFVPGMENGERTATSH